MTKSAMLFPRINEKCTKKEKNNEKWKELIIGVNFRGSQ